MRSKNILLSMALVSNALLASAQSIHVFGDSHANWGFSNFGKHHYDYNYNTLNIPFSVHWIINKTMHGIGKDGLRVLNIASYNMQENDIAVFVFGEIDARCHIGKQRDEQHRDVDQIITVSRK